MGKASHILMRACHGACDLSDDLFKQVFSAAAIEAISKYGITAGLTAVGLAGPTLIPVACTLAAIGGLATIKAIRAARKEKEVEAAAKRLDTRTKSIEETVAAMQRAIEESGVAIRAEDELTLREMFAAGRAEDLTKLSDATAQRLLAALDEAGLATAEQLGEVEKYTKETWHRTLLVWEQQHADSVWLREWEAKLSKKLEEIAADGAIAAAKATVAADNTETLKQDSADIKAMLVELLKQRPAVAASLAAKSTAKPIPVRTATGVTNIPAPEAHWIHRQAITRAIRAMLTSEGGTASLTAAVATAAGGYGKTFAARLYAHEHAADYPGGRFEIKIETSTMESQLATLLPLLSPGAELPPAEAAPRVRDILAQLPASLLIIDNVPNLAKWNEYLASGLVPSGHCQVLLTTREDDVIPDRAVQVPRFTTEEAWTILARARPDALDEANVKWVGRALRAADGLGVAIAAIAARMQATPGTSWKDYWTALRAQHPALFGDGALPPLIRPADAPADANQDARHHALLDDCYDHLPAATQRVLDYAALLPQDMAPRPWLESLMAEDATCTPPQTGESVVADAIAAQLLTPSGEDGKLLSLHRLWHARLNERFAGKKKDTRSLLLAIAACAASRRAVIVGRSADGTDRDLNYSAAVTEHSLRWELTPLATVCKKFWEAGQPGDASRVGAWLASVLQDLGRFSEAAACLQLSEATDVAVTAAIGAEKLAAAYSNLALVQQDLGDLSRARASIERAIALWSAHLAPDHSAFASAYSNLAMILQDHGDLSAAQTNMERAIEIDLKHFAPNHPTFAIRYSNLAIILHDMGKSAEAQAYMERAIAIAEVDLGSEHPNLATMRSSLGIILADLGNLVSAAANIERAIAINSKHFVPDHPAFASNYSNLAVIQQDQGNLNGARRSLERAIEIKHKHFAPNHPTFATSYNNLAHICLAEGDRFRACASFQKALIILLEHFDANHPKVRDVRRSIRNAGCGK